MKSLVALNRLNEIAFSFYTAGAFAAACNLDIFEHLEKAPLSAKELAGRIGVHPDACLRLLAAMQQLGLLSQSEGTFRNTEIGAHLTRGAEVPLWFTQKDHYFSRLWEYVPDAMREYAPRHQQAWNKTAQELYQAIYSNEDQLRQFFRLLDSYNVPIGEETAKHIDFSGHTRILDLAGGTGSFAGTVVKRHPSLTGVCLDLAPLRNLTEEMVKRAGLEGRFEFVTGDMFAGGYPKADVIFLSYILHNWSDENCIKILRHCHATLPSGGMLVVSEKVLNPDHSGDWWGVMMSLQMLVAFQPGAKERTQAEYQALFTESGFGISKLTKLDAPRDLLIALKP